MKTFCSSKKISSRHSVVHPTIPVIYIACPIAVVLIIPPSVATLEAKSSVFVMIVMFRVYTLLKKKLIKATYTKDIPTGSILNASLLLLHLLLELCYCLCYCCISLVTIGVAEQMLTCNHSISALV